jgi:hypothetical protein
MYENHFDLLLDELNRTQTHREYVRESHDLIKSMQLDSTKFNKSIKQLQTMTKAVTGYSRKLPPAKQNQAATLKDFPQKLKQALRDGKLTSFEACELESQYNRYMLAATDNQGMPKNGNKEVPAFVTKIQSALMNKSITSHQAMVLETRLNNLMLGGMQ